MPASGMKQYNLVKKLSFLRVGGTESEDQAAQILLDEIAEAGGKGERMPFEVPAYKLEEVSLAASAPFEKTFDAWGYGLSGCVDGEFDFFYAGRGADENFLGKKSLANTVVMIDKISYDAYKLMCDLGAAAFIVIVGKAYDTPSTHSFLPREIRAAFLENGKIPGFMIRAKDAMELVRRGAKKFKLKLKQTEFTATSRNVLATIPGTDMPEESIVLTAHYDSVGVGTGSWDNATGSANLMYLYRYFLKKPARRTLRFVWCGSEEQGLLGSKAFVKQFPDLLDEIKMCFNFDMCGTILGNNSIIVTGGEDLKTYAEQFSREKGWAAEVRTGVHSSDSSPFADNGIPGIGLCRGTQTAEIHSKNDLIYTISAEMLQDIGDFSSAMIERAANSAVLPVKKGMPEDMLKELDKYFLRDKKK